jgi:hypothetical protein
MALAAAGACSRPLCRTAGVNLPVIPDSHEGAIIDQTGMVIGFKVTLPCYYGRSRFARSQQLLYPGGHQLAPTATIFYPKGVKQ